ncbi:Putative F-box/LRR-repeat protein At3g18150 [Linum grandiflorum]
MDNSGGSQLYRFSKKLRNEDSTDRLSNLPDAVLHHILSFLDTRIAVQTSVLSRSWRCAWKYVPVLNFTNRRNFKRYVDKVLSLRYPLSARKIIYEDFLRGKDADALLVKVVEYAMSHATQHLTIHLYPGYGKEEFSFPKILDSILDCSLKTLYLRGLFIDRRFESFGFQLLTTLELRWCKVLNEDLDPFSKFPCLENLVLDYCSKIHSFGHGRLRISGLRLRSLKLVKMHLWKMEISAPNLLSFTLLDFNDGIAFAEITVPSLEHVDVQVTPDPRFFDVVSDITKEHWIFMFQGFRNVKSITLSNRIIKALCNISDFLKKQDSPFTRLEKLNLKWTSSNIPSKVVKYFFKRSSSSKKSINIL